MLPTNQPVTEDSHESQFVLLTQPQLHPIPTLLLQISNIPRHAKVLIAACLEFPVDSSSASSL